MYLYGNVCFFVKCILVYINIFYFKENYKHNVGIILLLVNQIGGSNAKAVLSQSSI